MKMFLVLFALFFVSLPSFASDKDLIILRNIPYEDKSSIQSNVRNECKELGSDFSSSITLAFKKRGYLATGVESLDVTRDIVLDIKILSLRSTGSVFSGHDKRITVDVKVYKNGEVGPSNVFTRRTKGRSEHGFSACSVLSHNAEILAKDIAEWYEEQH